MRSCRKEYRRNILTFIIYINVTYTYIYNIKNEFTIVQIFLNIVSHIFFFNSVNNFLFFLFIKIHQNPTIIIITLVILATITFLAGSFLFALFIIPQSICAVKKPKLNKLKGEKLDCKIIKFKHLLSLFSY